MDNPLAKADWDAIRVFVTVADSKSFRQASFKLGISVNTVRRTVERLEDQIGMKLLTREMDGARLTPEGRRVIQPAREVESSVANMWRVAEATAKTVAAPVRVAVTEGLGSFWLAPRLVGFVDDEDAPGQVHVQCAMGSVDVLRMEADISIQLVEPTSPDLIKKKLGTLHLMPFASPEYLERYGRPKGFADLVNHKIVEQATDQVQGLSEFLSRAFNPDLAQKMVRLKTNFSSLNYWSVASGGGIGLLPNYARLAGARLEHVDIGFSFPLTIWMASHPEMLKAPRHREFADLISDSFNRTRYPWFADRAMSPAAIDAFAAEGGLTDDFKGFFAPSKLPAGSKDAA